MSQPLDPVLYRDIVRRAIDEDVGSGDITTNAVVDAGRRARGVFLVKEPCVLAGLDVAIEAFRLLEPSIDASKRRHDGDRAAVGDAVAEITGRARTLLTAERTALNFLQRLSGIATLTRRFVDAAGGRLVILDTRKTTPTLRVLEKYAVRVGGATNHRAGLYDAILVKENHARLAGGPGAAVARVRSAHLGMPVEVEAQSLAEVDDALAAGAETILLDNLSPADVRMAVALIGGRARTEISGGVSLDRMSELASTGADSVSIGALTHSAPAVDISFEVEQL